MKNLISGKNDKSKALVAAAASSNQANNQAGLDNDQETTSMQAPMRAGLTVAFLVFGVFGLWAALAPIEGAAHAPGFVTVKSYKKVVQHLEGGIVADIPVQNGRYVEPGDTLLILDSTQPLAQLEIANAQYLALLASEARLLAERDGLASISYPELLGAYGTTAANEIEAQNQIFQARKNSLEGSIAVLEQRVDQLHSRVEGLKALRESKLELAVSFADELEDVRKLLGEGFADKNRLRELERNLASLKGEAAELLANISSTEIQIGETQLQILQQDKEFRTEVVSQLGETQSRIKDVRERITALQDVVSRTVVRAPVAGIVTGMQIHTIGGVIAPGTPIAEIVPQSDELVVESRVSIMDIDRVAEGQDATIRFSSFSGQTVPTVEGTVLSISADSILDQQTGMHYYLARVEVSPEGMARLQGVTLVPGMPAEVFIATGSRTMMQYLFKPLSNAVARSFIED